MDRKVFFARIRGPLFDGSMTAEAVQHVEAILDAAAAAGWRIPDVAYGLATAHHETMRFKHLKELGGSDYFRKMYDPLGNRPALAKANGNTTPGDGARYPGRGYVHITWKNNYRRAGDKIGLDLVNHPERAAEPTVAALVMISGMAEGWFTGKKLSDYLDRQPPDYFNARRIINGTDKAALIAGYAKSYEAALQAAGYAPSRPTLPQTPQPAPLPKAPIPVLPDPEQPQASEGTVLVEHKPGFWSRFVKALKRRLG